MTQEEIWAVWKIVLTVYGVVYVGLWVYIGATWDLDDGDECVGAFFLTLLWPAILICACIYGLFQIPIRLGKALTKIPALLAKIQLIWLRWRFKEHN